MRVGMRVGFVHRDYAAVGDVADNMLELDGGVIDVKRPRQPVFHLSQNALAG